MKHSFFIKAFEGKHLWWTYFVGILLVLLGFIIGQAPLSIILYQNYDSTTTSMEEFAERAESMDFSFFNLSSNFGFFLLLLSFVGGIIALVFVVQQIHRRKFLSIINPFSKVRYSKFFFGFGLWLLLAIIGEGVSYLIAPENYILTLNWGTFIPLFIICLLILPLQTSFEETFIRGYLMQGLTINPLSIIISLFSLGGFFYILTQITNVGSSINMLYIYMIILILLLILKFLENKIDYIQNLIQSIFRIPFIPLVITSLFFGLLHGMNPEVGEFGLGKMMTFYIGTGFFLGLLTILDEGLELALGIHFANNLFGALFVSFDGSALQTPTMFRSLDMNSDNMLIGWFIVVIIFMIIAQWKYQWNDWKKIFEPIRFSRNEEITINQFNNNILDEPI